MTRYVLVRLAQGIIALLLTTILVFFLVRLTGDPVQVMLGDYYTEEDEIILREFLGLNKPIYQQYLIFLGNLARGDWGTSLRFRLPALELIGDRAPASLILAAAAMVASIAVSLPAGVIAAVKRDRWEDTIAKGFAILGQSMPTFFLGIVLIQVMAVWLGWLPAGGYGDIRKLILPAITLGYHATAGILRLTRSSMLDILRSDFVRLGRIKGLPEREVIWKHALRNALIPVVTFIGIIYVIFLTGAVVVETIFGWPGLGRLAYESVVGRDYPLMQALIILFVGIFIIVNLAIDILYVYLDPRVRYVKG